MQWRASIFQTIILTLIVSVAIIVPPQPAPAIEVQTITVMAEEDLAVPLALISSRFTRGRTVSVSNNFGKSDIQKKKIEDGESADVFITSQSELVQQLKTKGMVDIYSITPIAARNHKTYIVAVVAGENMTPARIFLDYLKSDEARELFRQRGFEPS